MALPLISSLGTAHQRQARRRRKPRRHASRQPTGGYLVVAKDNGAAATTVQVTVDAVPANNPSAVLPVHSSRYVPREKVPPATLRLVGATSSKERRDDRLTTSKPQTRAGGTYGATARPMTVRPVTSGHNLGS